MRDAPTWSSDRDRVAALREEMRRDIASAAGSDVEGVILYGSRARGDARADSDWDVLVLLRDEVDWPGTRAALRRVQGRLAERFDERVAILPIRWRDADEHGGLLANIAREGEPL